MSTELAKAPMSQVLVPQTATGLDETIKTQTGGELTRESHEKRSGPAQCIFLEV